MAALLGSSQRRDAYHHLSGTVTAPAGIWVLMRVRVRYRALVNGPRCHPGLEKLSDFSSHWESVLQLTGRCGWYGLRLEVGAPEPITCKVHSSCSINMHPYDLGKWLNLETNILIYKMMMLP